MTRQELIDTLYANLYEKAGASTPTKIMLEAIFTSSCDIIAKDIVQGNHVMLPGIGTLKAASTAARAGRNPRTGAPITIPAGRALKIAVASSMKQALNCAPQYSATPQA